MNTFTGNAIRRAMPSSGSRANSSGSLRCCCNIQTRMLAGLLLICVSATWLSGCTNQVRVDSTWEDGVPHNQSFSRIIVVGVSPDANVRCDFEHFMATQLSSESVTATPSCNLMPINDPLTIESITAAVDAKQADAVLATILVAKNIGAQDGGKNETRGGGYYKATGTGYEPGFYRGYYGGYGAYGVPVTYVEFQTAAPITTISGEVEIATMIYETSGASLVYEVNTKAEGLESRDSALALITAPIADRLRRDGLIR